MTYLVWAAVFAMFVVVLLGYFLGCLNGSVLVSHFIIRDDVRQHGSGNAGLTNFYRTYGAKYALGVILLASEWRSPSISTRVISLLTNGWMQRRALARLPMYGNESVKTSGC